MIREQEWESGVFLHSSTLQYFYTPVLFIDAKFLPIYIYLFNQVVQLGC